MEVRDYSRKDSPVHSVPDGIQYTNTHTHTHTQRSLATHGAMPRDYKANQHVRYILARCRYFRQGNRGMVGPSGRSNAGIAVSNPARGMDVCLMWVSCVVR